MNYSDPFAHPRAVEYDAQTVAEWARQHCYTRTMRDALDVCMRTVLGVGAER
jgi:hypothetical protein